MGGTGVASGNYIDAPFTNPAHLASFDESDDFGLLLPSFIVNANNEDKIQDKIDNVQNSYDKFDASLKTIDSVLADLANVTPEDIALIEAAQNNAKQLHSDLSKFDETMVQAEINLGFVLAIPNKYVALALFAKVDADLRVTADVIQSDIAMLDTFANVDLKITNPQDLPKLKDDLTFDIDDIESGALVIGAAVTDIGLSFAKSFEVSDGFDLNVGISPKMQRVDLFTYYQGVDDFELDDATDEQYRSDDMNFNVDLGLSMNINDHWSIGVVGKNLIKNEYTHESGLINGFQVLDENGEPLSITYSVGPEAAVGFSYNGDLFTASVDLDVLVHDRIEFDNEDAPKFARAGVELNAWDWAQLRAGYRYDMEDVRPDMYTAGVGISPFGAFHLDFVVMTTEELNEDASEVGAGVEMSFTF